MQIVAYLSLLILIQGVLVDLFLFVQKYNTNTSNTHLCLRLPKHQQKLFWKGHNILVYNCMIVFLLLTSVYLIMPLNTKWEMHSLTGLVILSRNIVDRPLNFLFFFIELHFYHTDIWIFYLLVSIYTMTKDCSDCTFTFVWTSCENKLNEM